ncbi:MAG TPA: arginyltransferase, partial [Planctomycetaceae bacterium]|nr:arginyltransferase [Planctomycetaceae bacterium]
VYTHFDPDYSKYSLGTYAILRQIAWAQQTRRQYVYLGMYVQENSHLNYKSRFIVQQRLIRGEWVTFDSDVR